MWAPTLVRAASFYAPFSAGSGDVRFHTPLGVASPARPVATQPLVFWRFGGIAPGHFPYLLLREQPRHPATHRASLRRSQREDDVPMLPRRCCPPLARLARSIAFAVACPVLYGVASRLRRSGFHDVHPLLLLPLYAAWRVHNSRRVREVPAWRVPVASLCF